MCLGPKVPDGGLGAAADPQSPELGRCGRMKSEDELGPVGLLKSIIVTDHGYLLRITASGHFHLPLLANSNLETWVWL